MIFFFQVKYKIPVIDDIFKPIDGITSNIPDSLNQIAREFFSFYGKSYRMFSQVISPHAGQWLARETQSNGEDFSTDQQKFVTE